MLGVIGLILTGCAAPSRITVPPQTVVLSPQAVDEIAYARARELTLHALSHIGVPYRHGGSSPDNGFDCSGLVQYVYSRGAGIALPRTTQAMSAIGAPVAATELEPGDLVFFDTLRRPFSHVGIYVGDHRFIHAPTTGGAVELVDMRQRYWQSRYEGARRLSL